MAFSDRLKQRREELNITRSELAKKIGVTSAAISNYENKVSFPKEDLLYKLFKALDIDPNYLWQDDITDSKNKLILSPAELEHIKKYRRIDSDGKKTVDMVLDQLVQKAEAEQPSLSQNVPSRSTILYAAVDGGVEHKEVDEQQAQKVFDDLDSLPRRYKDR